MATRAEVIRDFFEKVKAAYIEDQLAKGIRASGKSAQSLRIQSNTTAGKLYGAAYIHFQKVGRKPGGFPPIEAIRQWIKDKGIVPENISEKSLAFLIARKIAKSGTDIFQKKRPGLDVTQKIEQFRQDLVKGIIQAQKQEMVNDMKNKLEKIKT